LVYPPKKEDAGNQPATLGADNNIIKWQVNNPSKDMKCCITLVDGNVSH